ncbi:FlgB family protein [Actibacterium sp. D379-3]
MFGKIELLQMAHGMATHAASRQSVLARNIANADTPGYRARDVASFADTYQQDTGDFAPRITRAGHLSGTQVGSPAPKAHVVAGAATAPNGNSVSLETEMMKAVETRGQHDMALSVYKSALGIMRSSLGR